MSCRCRKPGRRPLAVRRLTGICCCHAEQPHPIVDEVLTSIDGWERGLAGAVPADHRPRDERDDLVRRLYVQRAFDIGSANPMFPEYRFERIDTATASGWITFRSCSRGHPAWCTAVSRGAVRLRRTPPQLRGRQVGQDPFNDRLLSPPDSLETELPVRDRARPGRPEITSTATLLSDRW